MDARDMERCGFDDVVVTYDGRTAVDAVTLDVPPAAVTALVGGDGAGKTTLLRCLAGRVRPSRGQVHRVASDRVGVLAAGPPGYDDLTVAENLRFVARVRGIGADGAGDRGDTLLRAVGLADARDRPAALLSGGMPRKLGLALATLHDPDLLLLTSEASNLVATDTNGHRDDVFVRDIGAGTTTAVSRNHAGTGTGRSTAGWGRGMNILTEGTPVVRLLHPDDRERVLEAVRQRLEREGIDGSATAVRVPCDAPVHGWDRAGGIGADERLDHELVGRIHHEVEKAADPLSESGLFDPPVHVPTHADLQARMLGIFGRRA